MRVLDSLIAGVDARTGFDRWGPPSNPLIRRLTRRPTRLTLRGALWLAFGLGLGTLAITSTAMLGRSGARLTLFESSLFFAGWLMLLLAPLFTASSGTAGVCATSAERSTGAFARAGSAVARTTSPSTCEVEVPDSA